MCMRIQLKGNFCGNIFTKNESILWICANMMVSAKILYEKSRYTIIRILKSERVRDDFLFEETCTLFLLSITVFRKRIMNSINVDFVLNMFMKKVQPKFYGPWIDNCM